MTAFDPADHPHRRFNPLTGDWVQVFENKGAINGCSNPHPHCQVVVPWWASWPFETLLLARCTFR